MAWTTSAPVSLGSFAGPPVRSQAICAPEPQWPSTPCVLEISTSMLAASAGAEARGVEIERLAVRARARCGLSQDRSAPPASAAAPQNLARASA